MRNSLFFDSNGDNSFAVTKAGCIKGKAINTKNIQGCFNSCSYWTICAANEVLMSAKKGTFERDLTNGILHKIYLKDSNIYSIVQKRGYQLANLQKT